MSNKIYSQRLTAGTLAMGVQFKFMLSLLMLLATTSLYAVSPGFYAGLMGGPARNSGGKELARIANSTATTTATPDSKQLGARIFMGYKMNQYTAMEGGFSYFSDINYTANTTTCSGTTARVQTLDLVGKGSIPIQAFELYAKLGIVGSRVYTSSALNPDTDTSCGTKKNSISAHPTYSIGASYDVTQNWVADASWNYFNTGSVTKNMSMLALGISYHFVNKYCGQFLCDD